MRVKWSDRAWAAGFFEGEGHVRALVQKYRRRYPVIAVGQVNRAPLHRFVRIVGVGKVNGPYMTKGRKTPLSVVHVSGRQNVARVARLIWPWLSQRRRWQFQRAGVKAPV